MTAMIVLPQMIEDHYGPGMIDTFIGGNTSMFSSTAYVLVRTTNGLIDRWEKINDVWTLKASSTAPLRVNGH
jgi:hypothetical protein